MAEGQDRNDSIVSFRSPLTKDLLTTEFPWIHFAQMFSFLASIPAHDSQEPSHPGILQKAKNLPCLRLYIRMVRTVPVYLRRRTTISSHMSFISFPPY